MDNWPRDAFLAPAGVNKSRAFNRIFKRYALRVVFLEPFVGGVLIGKDLDVVDIAELFGCIDVDPDCFHWSLFNLRFPNRPIVDA